MTWPGVVCRDATHLWYPDNGKDGNAEAAAAKDACAQCPAWHQCLTVSIDGPFGVERHGIWAGTSYRQRLALKRQWAAIDTSYINSRRADAYTEALRLRVPGTAITAAA